MKKWLIRIAIAIGILLLLLIIAGSVFISNQAPDYDVEIKMHNTTGQVDIFYDEYAIPHIYAATETDAFKALGYVHAKDRLWQMDIMRRIAPGKLSELFGAATLTNDKFFRTIGLAQQSEKEARLFREKASSQYKENVMGYIDGINRYIAEENQTIEHKILGLEMAPYTLEDVYNVIGYMAFSFTLSHRTEPIVDFIQHKFGQEYLEALDIHVASGSVTINSDIAPDYSPISMHVDKIIQSLPAPELIGSNSWVIGKEKSASGNVILANDPHIGFSQPSVWYEAHLESPDFSVYGNFLAGFPFAQIGHNRHHAIGLTMFENDDLDYYRERANPDNLNQYWAVDHWEDFELRNEEIIVNGSDKVLMEVRQTRHGPIISDVVAHLSNTDPVSMWWVYQKFPLDIFEASYLILSSKTMEGVRKGASLIHAPGLNIMYGDVEGNVAWWASAKLPKRPGHVNSKMILDGATGKDDIHEYYNFNDNPQAINPKWGYVYSANNQSLSHDSVRHPGYYLPEDRGRRISNLLSAKNDWTIEDVKTMLLDVTSDNAPEIVASLLIDLEDSNLSEDVQEIVHILSDWNGAYHVNEVAPTIYVKLIYHVMQLMTGDELEDRWGTFNGTHLMKRSIQPMIANNASPWWDDIRTKDKETKNDIIDQALSTTLLQLKEQLGGDILTWTWDKVHTLEHPHSFDGNATIRSYFNVGPLPVPGGTEVINNYQFITSEDGHYKVKAGPSSRRAIDLSDLDNNSWGILPTGQSGNVLSPHYKDQAEMFVQGKFRKMLMDKEEIIKNQKYHTIISPQ